MWTTLAWIAYLYKLEQMHRGPFYQALCRGRQLAESDPSILRAAGEPPQMWCPFVAGDLSPAP